MHIAFASPVSYYAAKICGADVIRLKKPLDKYKLLFTLFKMSIKAEWPVDKIAAWEKRRRWAEGSMADTHKDKSSLLFIEAEFFVSA